MESSLKFISQQLHRTLSQQIAPPPWKENKKIGVRGLHQAHMNQNSKENQGRIKQGGEEGEKALHE